MANIKKIGIITMHRVQNNGSALQAYALQKKINDLGYYSEIIDYVFPNKLHRKVPENIFIKCAKQIRHLLGDAILGFPNYIRLKRFYQFYKNYYKLSKRTYSLKEELDNNPPSYDLLVTGSDQVWGPMNIGKDTTFMLSFCKDDSIPRISYSASFATDNIPEEFKPLYAIFLSKYQFISVRESSGIKIINDLIQKDATVVCDPTLLLNKYEWSKIASDSRITIKQPYILVYILTYAYNPYPEIDNIIQELQNQLGLHVIYLDGKLSDYKKKNSTVIRNAGPCEFVKLFMDAKYVITTSFHGTAFALNFSVPLYSVIKSTSGSDSRIFSLLKLVGAENRAIIIDTDILKVEPMDYNTTSKNIETLREESKYYLRDSIKTLLTNRT